MCSVNDFPTSRAVAHDPREAQPVFEQPWSDKWPVQLLRERSDDRGRRPPPPHSLGRWPLLIRRNFIDSDRYIRTWWRPSPTPRICPPYSLGGFPSAYLSVCLAVSMCTSRFHIFLNLCRGVFVTLCSSHFVFLSFFSPVPLTPSPSLLLSSSSPPLLPPPTPPLTPPSTPLPGPIKPHPSTSLVFSFTSTTSYSSTSFSSTLTYYSTLTSTLYGSLSNE